MLVVALVYVSTKAHLHSKLSCEFTPMAPPTECSIWPVPNRNESMQNNRIAE